MLLVAGVPGAWAQKRKKPELPPAPPPVVSGEASVYAGESVEIPLLIHGRRGEQLEFLIRNPPKTGKLSAVTSTGANSATVTYTAPAETAVIEDRFTYAVRSNDGVSAPGIITLKLRMKPVLPGRLEAPETLTFPNTVAGEESAVTLEVTNPGAGTTTGTVQASPPWSVDGSVEYRLPPKGSAAFRLIFRPEKAGAIKGEAVLGPQPRRFVALSAEALPPIVVTPARVKIAAAERGQTRMGTMEITNLSSTAQAITLSTDARLMTEKTVEVASGEKVQVPVFAEPGDGTGFATAAQVSAGSWKGEIPMEVEPLKLRLVLSADPAAELKGVAGGPAEIGILLENEGGRAAKALLAVTPPFKLAESHVTIVPQEKKRVVIAAQEVAFGEHEVEVVAETETAVQRLKVIYVATMDPAAPELPRAPRPVPPGRTEKAAPLPAVETQRPVSQDSVTLTRTTSLQLEDHPNALGNFTQSIGTDRATLVWPADLGGKSGVIVEERRLALSPDRNLTVNWVPLEHARFVAADEQLRVELTKLQPEKLYTVRARSGDDTIFTAQFTTRAKPSLWPFGWRGTLLAALFGLLAFFGWRAWKTRRRSHW